MPNAYFEGARAAIQEAVDGLTPDIIAREVPGRWSIGEILEHLTLGLTATAATLEKALASGELRARKPGVMAALIRMLVIDVGYFPRAKSPEGSRPTRSIPPDRSVSALLEAVATLDATLGRVSARFGDDVLVSNHPYFSGLTVPQWRKFHWRHTRHHMTQVKQRRQEIPRTASTAG